MKKILFAVYDKFSHDQRAIETIESLNCIGDLTVVSFDKLENKKDISFVVSGKGKRDYIKFKKTLIKTYKKLKPDIVFLHDYYTAFFIYWLKKHNQKVIIGYDSSELYYDRLYTKNIKSIYLNIQERKYLKYADFVFSANKERSEIMKDVFQLKNKPIVWDNIHRIDDIVDDKKCSIKFQKVIDDSKNIIFYCGGISNKRGTFELINAIEELGDEYQLIIAGSNNKEDLKKYYEILDKSFLKNFCYVGYLTRSELKYILKKSKISVSIFDMSCVNQIFCASGKIYEALFEGIPILTSCNPPFKRICETYGIGESTEDYAGAIKKIISNYDNYSENIKKYINTINYENRIKDFSKLIENEIKEKEGLK